MLQANFPRRRAPLLPEGLFHPIGAAPHSEPALTSRRTLFRAVQGLAGGAAEFRRELRRGRWREVLAQLGVEALAFGDAGVGGVAGALQEEDELALALVRVGGHAGTDGVERSVED